MCNKVNLICATCEHFHVAIDQGKGSCGKACGGPKEGKVFPLYKGFLTSFATQCFICSEVPYCTVRVENEIRRLGVCIHHKDFVLNMLKQAGGMEIVQKDEDREKINEKIIKSDE